MSPQEVRDVSAAVSDAIGRGDYDALRRLFSPELAPGFCQDVAALKEAFPDFAGTNELYIVEGDRVATRWVYHGTHRGTFFDIPATGKRVTFTGMSIDRVVDGRIVETAFEWDLVGVLRQLGATRLPDEEPMSETRAQS